MSLIERFTVNKPNKLHVVAFCTITSENHSRSQQMTVGEEYVVIRVLIFI